MRRTLKRLAGTAAALALVGAVSITTASPAAATTTQCHVVTNHCETAIIRSSAAGHWIRWKTDAGASGYGCSWRVIDDGNGVVVGSGRVGAFLYKSNYIYGLYGYYRLELYSCGTTAFGWIANEV